MDTDRLTVGQTGTNSLIEKFERFGGGSCQRRLTVEAPIKRLFLAEHLFRSLVSGLAANKICVGKS